MGHDGRAHVDAADTVRAEGHPVTAPGPQHAAQPGTVDRPAGGHEGHPGADRGWDELNGFQVDPHIEQMLDRQGRDKWEPVAHNLSIVSHT